MRIAVPRRVLRRTISLATVLFVILSLWYIVLPPDSAIRLSVQFNASRVFNFLRQGTTDRDAWLKRPAEHPIDLRDDVAYLSKTGYGTVSRLQDQVKAFHRNGDSWTQDGENFIIMGDFSDKSWWQGYEIHDAVKRLMETKVAEGLMEHPRFVKYRELQEAIKSKTKEGTERAKKMSREFGWELDALKFIMGMELMYERMPHKKWYVILDDDTFVVTPSLQAFLSHLDPKEPHYIGNAVGDYSGRFAHGGSGIVLSGEAMKRLFSQPQIISAAYIESLDVKWGDKLVATTLQKVGIYLDERYSHHFNGEPPRLTRITPDRFCAPIISFHQLRQGGGMEAVADAVKKIKEPVLWGQLYKIFRGYTLTSLGDEPIQEGHDHVGPKGGTKKWTKIEAPEACRQKCMRDSRYCMAWTHDSEKKECFTSPWMVIGKGKGDDAPESVDPKKATSGINGPKIEALEQRCL